MASGARAGAEPERRRAWLIGLALFCCYAYFFYLGGNWNVESRSAQIFALAEHGSLVIDDYPFLPEGGGDAAHYRGHFYSDKLIGPSLVSVPIYWIARRSLTAWGMGFRLAVYVALRITNIIVNAIPSALIGVLLYLFLVELGLSAQLRVWLALAYGLGTLALPYSTAFFGHQFAAACVIASFLLLWRQRQEWSPARGMAAGALAGLAAISDVMGLVVALFLGFYTIWVAARGLQGKTVGLGSIAQRVGLFALPGAVVFGVQLAANWSSFGSALTMPHIYHAQQTFRARHTAGLFGIHLPQLYPLYQLTVGPWRGIFYSSPVLILAVPGIFLLSRRWRAEAAFIAAAWLAVVLLNSGYENWTTGSSFGPRYQLAAIPLLMVAAAPAARRWPAVFKCLAVISIAFMAAVTAQSPFVPEDARNPLATALAGFARGELLHGNAGRLVGLPGLLSLLPLAVLEAACLCGIRRAK